MTTEEIYARARALWDEHAEKRKEIKAIDQEISRLRKLHLVELQEKRRKLAEDTIQTKADALTKTGEEPRELPWHKHYEGFLKFLGE